MGGHGHGHGAPYEVPHPSIYKIDNIPQLKQVQESLCRQGLKDPWLRNEAWRYDVAHAGTHASRLRTFLFRGLPIGVGAFLITIGVEYALGLNQHGHGHEGGHSEEHKTEGKH